MDMVSYIISLRLMPNGIYRDHKRNGVVVQNEPLDRYSFLNVACRINYIITNVCGIIHNNYPPKDACCIMVVSIILQSTWR